MEIVISACGSFYLPYELERLDLEWRRDAPYAVRTSPIFIEWVKTHPESELKVVTIPAEATDYDILEYDGLESVVYVVDGKIHYLC